MKKLLLSILLMCYTVVMLKPVLPFMADFIGHVFFYTQHMATVHYENGAYHVHYETAKDVKEEKSDKSTSSAAKKDNSSNEYIITATKQQPAFIATLKDASYALTATPSLASSIAQNNYPPPRL